MKRGEKVAESHIRQTVRQKVEETGLICVTGWVEDLMQIPALQLAEKAEKEPTYRLAIVDSYDVPKHDYLSEGGYIEIREWAYRRVVEMEER